MIVGLDCSKFPKSRDRNFVMVSSYDEYSSKYYTSFKKSPLEDIVASIDLLTSSLKNFQLHRGFSPEYIIIYRSGCSDRDKELILSKEIEVIKNHLALKDNPTKLCYIIVNKKTEMKFFHGDKNPQGGTVVETGCVNPFIYEFYLQPQEVFSGTATPTHFHVLYDSTNFSCETIQVTSYHLCYYYFNWSGAIRVPAPLKYAEVCNNFVTSNLTDEINHEDLQTKAYYI
jgi:aubergine-like protein